MREALRPTAWRNGLGDRKPTLTGGGCGARRRAGFQIGNRCRFESPQPASPADLSVVDKSASADGSTSPDAATASTSSTGVGSCDLAPEMSPSERPAGAVVVARITSASLDPRVGLELADDPLERHQLIRR